MSDNRVENVTRKLLGEKLMFNINWKIRVKLTDAGIEYLKTCYLIEDEEVRNRVGLTRTWYESCVQNEKLKNRYLTAQMHTVMSLFAPLFHAGSVAPFETEFELLPE